MSAEELKQYVMQQHKLTGKKGYQNTSASSVGAFFCQKRTFLILTILDGAGYVK